MDDEFDLHSTDFVVQAQFYAAMRERIAQAVQLIAEQDGGIEILIFRHTGVDFILRSTEDSPPESQEMDFGPRVH